MKPHFILSLLLSGCTASSPWEFDSIATGEKAFDSTRLVYQGSDSFSQANLEFFCSNGHMTAYLSSPARRLGGQEPTVKAKLTLGTLILEEELPLHEGKMRVKPSDEWAAKTIKALKDGQEVAIMVGVIDQIIQPEQFSEHFEKLAKKSFSLLETFQGTTQ